ncbi:MAG: tRNA 4-thiouridine(8) synthase ThiI [Clostridia bacterium]|nr:tRNA 4-thiouridine(8) synthase ThiI [Clostridia bacterium]
MDEIILIKNGELALKGLNRHTFEDMLIKNMRQRLTGLGHFDFSNEQSTIVVKPRGDVTDMDEAFSRLCRVFGIAGLSRAASVEKDMNTILKAAEEYLGEKLLAARTFKVNAKRSDKSFPLGSPEICSETGGYLLSKFHHLKVDVHNPDIIVNVEIRDTAAYIHGNQVKGAGGMPVGSSGRAALLISGGIDSPVAGYMMAKRGLQLTGIHFASPPYTSKKAEQKVCRLLEKVAMYSGRIVLFIVPFTEIQEQIKDNCPEELFTLVMRRMMMRIAQIIAADQNCGALITGESVGQVASQTMPAIACTEAVCDIPVFRPLIGMDKDEVVAISRKIDTFDISILPYEDCCTVFTPKHPRTRPTIPLLEKAEQALDIEPLIEKAVKGVRMVIIHGYKNDDEGEI